jgi:succinoglycan biosynthesis transport protein ExoP
MDIIYLFRVLLKRKWIILGAGLLAAALAFFLTMNEQKYYRSSTQFSTGYASSDDINVTGKEVNLFEADTKFNNVLVTFTSPSVTSLLSYALMLHDLENPATAFTKLRPEDKATEAYTSINIDQARRVLADRLETMSMLTSYKPDEKKLLEFIALYGYDMKTIQKQLNVYRVQRTDFVQVDYLSPNPELSAFAVNKIYDYFLRYYRGVRGDRAQESIDTLRSIMKKKEEELVNKNAVLREKGIYVDPEATVSTMGTLGELELNLSSEQSKLTALRYELQKIDQRMANITTQRQETNRNLDNDEIIAARRLKNDAYRAWQENPSDRDLESRYNRLNDDYNRKLRQYNATSYDRPAEPRVGDTREELMAKRRDVLIDIKASESNIGQLNAAIGRKRGEVNSQSQQSTAVQTLIKERDQANEEYLEAKKKYNDAIDQSASTINNFRQIIPGQPAIEPEPSKRKMIVGMAGAAAMITVILILIFMTYMDSSIKTPVIFSKTVGLRLISMVNFMNLRDKNLFDIISNKDTNVEDAERSRNNIFRESLRKLRYEIETSGKKIFLFTSTRKGQGKTTLIQALSYSMSLSKKKILIIDTNFCNNDLTVQLNAEPILEKLVPYKSDGQAMLEQVKVFSKEVGAGTVFAIGSEGGDYTPSEVLPRENLLHHLDMLTNEFDYIFLEGPPLNDFSDSKELAQYVEGVIAVFSAQDAIKQIDKQSISFFRELNGKFCGSILNMVDLHNVDVA